MEQHAQRAEPIAEALVLRWLRELSSALSYVHAHRVLHRDVKPQNILLTLEQRTRLSDFGESRMLSSPGSLARTVVGTPCYMAPEVLRSEAYAEPADVWGLGVVLYELCTLRRPFQATQLGALVHQISSAAVDEAPLSSSSYPRALWALATSEAMLHPDAEQRLTLHHLGQHLPPFSAHGVGGQHLPPFSADGVGEGLPAAPDGTPPPSPLPSGPSAGMLPWSLSSPSASSFGALTSVSLGGRAQCAAAPDELGVAAPTTIRSTSQPTGHAAPDVARAPPCCDDRGATTQATTQATTIATQATPQQATPCDVAAVRLMAEVNAIAGPLIRTDQLRVGEPIGTGGFATVHRGTLLGGTPLGGVDGAPQEVAVKVLRAYPTRDSQRKQMLREITLMGKIDHPNVMRILGICATPSLLALVMPLMAHGSVYHWLHRTCRGVPPPALIALRLLIDTAAGLAHLHSRTPRIAHRDVKSMNLLLDTNFVVRVSDFGLSREFSLTHPMSRVGTVQYVAPEVLLGHAYSHKCDVWSYGIVCWELLTALVPFNGLSSEEVVRKVALEGLRLPPPAQTPHLLLRLMAQCWATPAKRPEFAKVLSDLVALQSELRVTARRQQVEQAGAELGVSKIQ